MAKSAPSRAEKYRRLSKEAARLLGVKVTDPRCEHYATLRLARDAAAAKLIDGQDVDPAVLLRIDESLQALMPVPKMPPIKVVIVDPTDAAPVGAASVDGHIKCRRCGWQPPGNDRVSACYRCGWTGGADLHAPWKPLALDVPADGDVLPQPATEVAEKPKPAKPRALPKPKPSIHGPGAPLRADQHGNTGERNEFLGGFTAPRPVSGMAAMSALPPKADIGTRP